MALLRPPASVPSLGVLIGQGVHPKVVSERLGHSTIGITLDTYSHLIPTIQQEAAARVNALLAPSADSGESTRTDS
ncbi:MAG TPA: hypothetical protein VFJ58_14995 [Armatimonadota bacterium]|nr:hypothetical protein [Armatimonadota bacterium]